MIVLETDHDLSFVLSSWSVYVLLLHKSIALINSLLIEMCAVHCYTSLALINSLLVNICAVHCCTIIGQILSQARLRYKCVDFLGFRKMLTSYTHRVKLLVYVTVGHVTFIRYGYLKCPLSLEMVTYIQHYTSMPNAHKKCAFGLSTANCWCLFLTR